MTSTDKARELEEKYKPIIEILFAYRHSNTISQKVYNKCEVCERSLEEEYFEDRYGDTK